MAMLVLDKLTEDRVKAERERSRVARFDEVWNGVYVVAPFFDNEHQEIRGEFGSAFCTAISWTGRGVAMMGANISDREVEWEQNYRIPDVVVFMNGGAGEDRKSHYFGGPDFAVEIVTPGDRTREKFAFYDATGVRELLIVDRRPWRLELFRRSNGKLSLYGVSTLAGPNRLTSNVLPMAFRLIPGETRPRIAITHTEMVQRWLA